MLSADTRKRINTHIANLASEEDKVSFAAERRLIRFGSKAVDALIEATSSANPQVRFRAVWALGKIGDARAFDTIAALTNDADEAVWYDAILALGNLGDARAIPLLVALVHEHTPEDPVRSGVAAQALIKFGDKAIPPLQEMIKTGNPETQQRALDCFEHLKEAR